jgi:O-antigen/teichoic acid export membrane protein
MSFQRPITSSARGLAGRLSQLSAEFFGRDVLEVLRHSNNYFWGNLAAQGMAFLSIPVFTRLLSPADYGTFQVFRSYASVFIIVLTLNFHGSISRYYYDQPQDYKEFVGTSTVGSVVFLGLASVMLILFRRQAAQFLGLPEALLLLLLPLTFIKIFDTVFNSISIARKESFRYSVVNNLRSLLGYGLGIALIFAFRQDKYQGPVLGQFLAGVLVGAGVLWLLRGQIAWKPKWEHVSYIFGYSLPLIPYLGSSLLLDQLDRILINKNLGAADAGLYSFAYNIGMVVSLATDAVHTALVPDWFRLMREQRYEDINVLVNKLYRITLVLALGAILFSKEIVFLLSDKEYHPALVILPIVIIGYVFDNLSKTYLRSIGFTNKMIYVSLVGIITVTVNFVLNIIYLPRYGYVAGAYTTVVSFVILFALAWGVAKYALHQPVTPLRVFLAPSLFFATAVVLYYVLAGLPMGFVYSFLLRILILAGFAAVSIAFTVRRRPQQPKAGSGAGDGGPVNQP